jgi:hypothetical protein
MFNRPGYGQNVAEALRASAHTVSSTWKTQRRGNSIWSLNLHYEPGVPPLLIGGHQRLGDAVLAAQSAYAETWAVQEPLIIYHLLGDPALKIEKKGPYDA